MAIKGENKIIKINLFQINGVTPLLVSSLSYAQVKIVQYNKTLATYLYGTDAEVRQGDSTSQLEVELKKSVADLLKDGIVYVRLTMELSNAEFTVDTVQRDIQIIEAFTVDGL